MSILMEALKQQNQHTPVAADSGAFWRKLALILALLLAGCVGAAAAYWLMPPARPEPVPAADAVSPAQPVNIFAALSEADSKAAASAAATAIDSKITLAIKPLPEPVKEEFTSLPSVTTVTAGTAAAEPQPLALPEPEISGELRDKFASALKATENTRANNTTLRSHNAPATDIHSLDAQLQQQIPPLRFDAHVYATSVSQRWVKVNGKTLQEGQWVTADIRIKEITPQYVLLELGTQLFSVAALTEWPAG
ncbi:Type II secretion system protein B [Rheinheimera pacifica]|uniref:Type II secretion system protein B n=1 Tax=Rheinheimera pacifica TaxID=173990 RepID=A0A1H6NEA3_9GAMM|nr:general secretion pathway protein GspB [Rheinheimera pacifica]SEI10225.1 Type II secretion system protein B [Rheinheimera pacifica]